MTPTTDNLLAIRIQRTSPLVPRTQNALTVWLSGVAEAAGLLPATPQEPCRRSEVRSSHLLGPPAYFHDISGGNCANLPYRS